MIKNILWDFDGVILDSMKIKGDGFGELFKEYDPKNVASLVEFHYKNGGISRFEKIKYFFNTLLQKDISDDEVNILADKFAEIIEEKLYGPENLIEDSLSFIKINYTKYNFHIVSGAEHSELNSLCKEFGIDKYFLTVEGSPTKKVDLVKNLLSSRDYKIDETILIGDSINDYNAAYKNSIGFYGYNNLELNKYNYIDSFDKFKINGD